MSPQIDSKSVLRRPSAGVIEAENARTKQGEVEDGRTMVSEALLRQLRDIVGERNVLWKKADLQTYEYDGPYLEKALPEVVVLVDSTEQVSAVVKLANKECIPFVPRGRGTNLSGGALAVKQGIVIELANMNRILEIDIPNERMIVESGVYNLEVSNALAPLGYYYAPDPASGKACSMGGNVAENAGGPHCFKYGVTSNYVLGLEVVLPDGEIVWLGGKAPDLPGLDLVGAFVGSEGTFGICTQAILRIMRLPEAVKTMLAVYDSLDDASNTVSAIVAKGMILATLEMMDNLTIQAVEDSVAAGFPRDAAAVLLLELDGLQDGMDEMAEEIVAICEANNAREVRVARSAAERAALWKGRKGAFGAVARLAPNYLVADATVPRTKLPATLRKVMEVGDKYGLRIANVFHAGDGNLHPLILFDSRIASDCERVMKAGMEIMAACVEAGGTISGEHGVGIEKSDAMKMIFSDSELRVQEWVKDAFDPKDLCNPGKIFPSRVARSEAVHAA
jgi:glycolate oxidase